jgi:MATE family multidrug resistance protein
MWQNDVRETLKLAGPLLLVQLAGVGMTATDILYAGQFDPRALTAIAVSLNFDLVLMVVAMGVFMAVAPMVSQRRGAGHSARAIAPLARSSLALALLLGAGFTVLVWVLAVPVIPMLIDDPASQRMAIDYLEVYAYSTIAQCLWFALRFVAEGLGINVPVLRASLLGLVVNAVAAPLLMYGAGPLPALGLAGAAWASVCAYSVMTLMLATAFAQHPVLKPLALFASTRMESGAIPLLLRQGLPVGLTLLAESGIFVVMVLFMARISDSAVAAHEVAVSISALIFMVPVSIGLASAVRVGYAAGANDRIAAQRAGWTGIALGQVCAVFSAALLLAAGGVLAGFYTDDAHILRQVVPLLWVAGVFQLVDALQTTATSVLRGLGETQRPMHYSLLGYWGIGLPAAWYAGFVLGWGAEGLWWGLTAGISTAALLLGHLFWRYTRAPIAAVAAG